MIVNAILGSEHRGITRAVLSVLLKIDFTDKIEIF